MNNITTLRLIKEGLAPNNMRAEDFASVIVSYVDMLRSITRNMGLLSEDEQLECAIIGIKSGSVKVEIEGIGESGNIVDVAVDNFQIHVLNNDFHDYDRITKEKIRVFSKSLKRMEAKAEIGWKEHQMEIDFSKMIIPPLDVSDRTYLYGELVTIGGKEPNIHIDLPEYGKLMKCSASREIIRKLANRIYTVIGVSGIATYDLQTMELTGFVVEDILPYDESKRAECFEQLNMIVSKYFPGEIHQDD